MSELLTFSLEHPVIWWGGCLAMGAGMVMGEALGRASIRGLCSAAGRWTAHIEHWVQQRRKGPSAQEKP